MYKLFPILLIISFYSCTSPKQEEATQPETNQPNQVAENSGYDAELAQKLGADDYGMRKYVMAFLKSGPNRDQDSVTAANLQKAHMENIGRMAEEGKLVLAGPFMDSGEFRGIYIFDVETVEEAKALTESDPAIQAGRLVMELHPWYGSAAIKQIVEIHEKISVKEP
ncbi:YciI family protein [Flexithrix dorotheae]|uniref:YciI family protein n=1 Tax=Flexithrix dorotheae TaxID=70993 RepID=UPI000376BAF9|nr:YciI family protein [Flexithrix dorotheae]